MSSILTINWWWTPKNPNFNDTLWTTIWKLQQLTNTVVSSSQWRRDNTVGAVSDRQFRLSGILEVDVAVSLSHWRINENLAVSLSSAAVFTSAAEWWAWCSQPRSSPGRVIDSCRVRGSVRQWRGRGWQLSDSITSGVKFLAYRDSIRLYQLGYWVGHSRRDSWPPCMIRIAESFIGHLMQLRAYVIV